ncbi:hypothetical protein H4R34_001989 [Dimargaris verticillata]|uniref:Major facilitator superfamily (MFS) profile domain-containing protein n=1 Tax=Dimargaris verticillata TaxID=2761393 RepID=A0A9W8B9N1_9FUNG|nr:hypothetical protein H4R34_001989 [Dimargaris verticillata]
MDPEKAPHGSGESHDTVVACIPDMSVASDADSKDKARASIESTNGTTSSPKSHITVVDDKETCPSSPREINSKDDDEATEDEEGSQFLTSDAATATTPAVPRSKMFVIMCGLCLSLFLAYLDITIVATALPAIGFALDGFSEVSWIASAYLLTFTPLQPLYGRFSDIFGRVPVLLVSNVVFMVGCAICGSAPNMPVMIIGRAIAGVGGAGLISLPMIVVADLVPLHQRALYLGIFGGMFALASVLGPILGGLFTDHVSWKWVFYFNLPVGAVTFIIIVLFLRIPHEHRSLWRNLRRIDYLGAGSLMGAIVFVLLATMWGGSVHPWNSPIIIAFYCLFVFCIVSFVVVELKFAKEPIIPLRLFLYRNFALANICILLIGVIILGSVFYLPIFYNIVRNDTATMSGVKLLPLLLSLVVATVASGLITSKTGRYRPLIWIGAAVTTVGLGLMTMISNDEHQANEIGFLVVLGAGCGMCLQTLMLVAQSAVPEDQVAVATSCFSFFQTIGSGIGIAAMSAILNNNLAFLLSEIPGINVSEVITNPSLLQHNEIPADTLGSVQDAYVTSIRQIFYVLIPLGGLTFITSLGLRHIPLNPNLLPTPAG